MVRVRCRVLGSFFGRFRGLMFSTSVSTPLLFVFSQPGRHAIHSLFCPPFDAIFLDSAGKVVDVFEVRTVQLWVQPRRDASYLIEAAPGFGKGLKEGQAIGVDVDGAWLDVRR